MRQYFSVFLIVASLTGVLTGCDKLAGVMKQDSAAPTRQVVGYVEGDYRYLAAPYSGWLKSVPVNLGDRVQSGQMAFNYRSDAEQLAVNQANAQLQSQIAQSKNLTTGARPVELTSLEAQLKSAQAQLQLAKQTLSRYQQLQRSGAVAQVQVDEMVAQVKSAQANVDSIQGQIRAANLPAREQALNAAIATSKAAQAALEKAQWQLGQLNVNSDLTGEVSQVYYHTGEYVTQGQPIVQILPDNHKKVIFYVAQELLSTLKIGQTIRVQPVTTPASLHPEATATIRYISPQASYTPPVIYSNENANKLTFRIEATLNPPATQAKTASNSTVALQVGQPVQVAF